MNAQRKGQSLIEFALVALVMYLLLGAILTFGHALYVAQQVQMSADFLAREISRQSLAYNTESLDVALETLGSRSETETDFKRDVYDESLLEFPIPPSQTPEEVQEEIAGWPLVNRMLSTIMIRVPEGAGFVLRYPGAENKGTSENPRYQIFLPNDTGGKWVDVVEEVVPAADVSRFPLTGSEGGVVALRINYPVHSPIFSAMRPAPFGEPNAGDYIEADPNDFDEAAPNYLDPRTELYGGDKGLGRQYAWGTQVRPYRRIVSGQAVYRREVFQP